MEEVSAAKYLYVDGDARVGELRVEVDQQCIDKCVSVRACSRIKHAIPRSDTEKAVRPRDPRKPGMQCNGVA